MINLFFTKKKRKFSPKDLIGLKLWIDASDITTITKDGSNLVSQINDKSGNVRHATATTTARPTFTVGYQNGKSALVLDGVANQLSIPNLSPISTQNRTVIVAFKQILNKAGGNGIFHEGNYKPLLYTAGGNLQGNWSGATGMPGVDYTANIPISENANHSLIWENDSTSYLVRLDKSTKESGSGSFPATLNGGVNIGTYNSSVFANIALYECLVFNESLTLSQIQQVESYLSKKWGF